MKRKIVFLVFLMFVITSCNTLNDKLTGGWLIEKVYYHGKLAIYDLYTNSFDLLKDGTCANLPISSVNEKQPGVENGTWKSYTQNSVSYLEIKTSNNIFNRKFKIVSFTKEPDYKNYGSILKMTLAADSIKIICAKVPIYGIK